MPSKLGAIRTLIKTQLESTSINVALNSIVTESTRYPAAFFQLSESYQNFDVSNTLDRAVTLEINIIGTTLESIDLAVEEVMVLWLNRANLAAQNALGVMMFRQVIGSAPIVEQKGDLFVGFMQFDVVVRYDYTT